MRLFAFFKFSFSKLVEFRRHVSRLDRATIKPSSYSNQLHFAEKGVGYEDRTFEGNYSLDSWRNFKRGDVVNSTAAEDAKAKRTRQRNSRSSTSKGNIVILLTEQVSALVLTLVTNLQTQAVAKHAANLTRQSVKLVTRKTTFS